MKATAFASLLDGPFGGDLVEVGLPAPVYVHVTRVDPAEWLGADAPTTAPAPRVARYERLRGPVLAYGYVGG